MIVGAGIAGLSAALHLAERGVPAVILEADPTQAGGRAAGGASIEVDHERFGGHFRDEHGVHAIWSPYRNLQAMLARHGIRPVLVPADEEEWIYKRLNWVRRAPVGGAIRHSWIPAPFHYLNLFLRPRFLGMLDFDEFLGLLPVWGSLLWGLGVDPLGEGQPLEGMWLDDLIRGWSPALRELFVGLTRNGLSGLPGEIPLSGFIAFLRFYTLLRRDAWVFAYLPTDGGTSLVDPLAARVQALGTRLEVGTRVTHLERMEEGWRVHWQGVDGRYGATEARDVILATDAPNNAAILRASPELAPAAGDFYWPRGMATAVVRIWFDGLPRAGAEAGILSGDFVPDNFFWLHRIHDDYVHWHRATGGSAIEVHVYGPPATLADPDAVLLARCIADVHSAFPELRGHDIWHQLRRNEATHTLLSVGPADRHPGIELAWPGLYCCGDWVRHPSPAFFLERACVTGIAAANSVLARRGVATWRLLDPPAPEPLAGAIERLMIAGRRVARRGRGRAH
ncbi:MAG TPA: FAD-dependent oxidoreductase [Anaerolineae bacterium]|nr:FAD-dependent oxidoreductase [Anaerolineae bacterium]